LASTYAVFFIGFNSSSLFGVHTIWTALNVHIIEWLRTAKAFLLCTDMLPHTSMLPHTYMLPHADFLLHADILPYSYVLPHADFYLRTDDTAYRYANIH
jgi:hypothetical protein